MFAAARRRNQGAAALVAVAAGRYLLGAYLIDASSEVLRVESALAIEGTDVVHHHRDGDHVTDDPDGRWCRHRRRVGQQPGELLRPDRRRGFVTLRQAASRYVWRRRPVPRAMPC